jgi:hypothetical protein
VLSGHFCLSQGTNITPSLGLAYVLNWLFGPIVYMQNSV